MAGTVRKTRTAKKKDPIKVDETFFPELSEDERNGLQKMVGKKAVIQNAERDTVPKEDHDEEVAGLKDEKEKLRKKNDDLKREKERLVEERDALDARLKSAMDRCSKLESDLDERSDALLGRDAEIGRLREDLRKASSNRQHLIDTAVAGKNAEIQDLTSRMVRMGEERDSLTAELREASDEIESLKARIAELESGTAVSAGVISEGAEFCGEVCGTVSRDASDSFSSDLFSDGRYRVALARNGGYVRFSRDVEGRAVCSGGRIVIPDLETYLPFSGAADYQAVGDAGGEFRIILQDRPRAVSFRTGIYALRSALRTFRGRGCHVQIPRRQDTVSDDTERSGPSECRSAGVKPPGATSQKVKDMAVKEKHVETKKDREEKRKARKQARESRHEARGNSA
ncbi:MAG: hypothetical protein Q4Q62_08405 [Thermoplasmata archaeon]|nr:hypothetical protein [Thermoplasmata archaeon]